MSERVLVAGATGFIGRAIVRELAARGHQVRALYHAHAPSFGEGVETIRGDVTDAATLKPAVEDCTAIVDCVQFPSSPVEQPRKGRTFERVDLGSVRNLLANADAAQIRRFVYLSGTNLSETSPLPSHRAKARAERAIIESGIPYTFVKPSMVVGEGSRPMHMLATLIRRAPFIPVIGGGESKIQPVYVGDVARLVADALDAPAAAHRAIEIGGLEVMTMKELMLRLASLMGVRKPVVSVPFPLVMLGASLAALLPNPPLSPDAVRFLTLDVDVNNATLFELFPGFELMSTDEALRRSLA